MEVAKPDTVTPVIEWGGGDERKHPESQADGGSGGSDGDGPRRAVGDAISILDIPAEEMTPRVSAAIRTLSAEIVRLREEVEVSCGRAAYLEELADRHPFLPVLNRRAFARELAKILSHVGELETLASLLCLHVSSAEDIRRRHGRHALDEGLAHVCSVLTEVLHPTDIVGNLGGADFGAILLVADKDTALAKGKALVDAIARQPFHWQGEDVFIGMTWGARVLESAIDANDVMAAADRQLLEMAAIVDAETNPAE